MMQSTQIEKELFETNMLLEQYQLLLDKSTSISKSDLHGHITYVNDNFCKLSGYTREEIMGKPHSIFRAPDVDRAVYKELWATIQSKKIWRGTVKNRAKDGSYYYFEATIMPLLNYNQEIVEYISVRTDNTEKTKLLEDVSTKEKELHYISSILSISDEARIIIDTFAKIVDFNEKAKSIFEYLRKDITIGKLLEEEEEEEEEEVCRILRAIQLRQSDNYIFEYKNHHYKMCYKEVNKTLFMISFFDITELANKNKMLLLQSRQAAMGEMLSMVAHQWRQPLSSISLTLLNMKIKFELNKLSYAEFDTGVSKVSNIISHLSKTIELFQDYFKEKDGSKVTLANIFESVENIIQPILEKNSIELFYEKENALMQRYKLDNRLDQVLLNIYQNAIDALKEKSDLEDRKIKVQIYEDTSTGFLHILICDNAGGIAPHIVEKIFDPYVSTKSKNGTGIGLYMSKKIVQEALNGNLHAFNKDGGACFNIVLKNSF